VIREDGESMASLCREFGISRKTGYKIFERYEKCGLEGLSDRTRRLFRYANRLPHGVKIPAASTIHAVLDHGLVAKPIRRRTRTEGTPLLEGLQPNDLWCTDYKGEFMLPDKRYCYPLTVTDYASRNLVLCEAMESNAEKPACTAFERLFQERGLPRAIRSGQRRAFRFSQRPVQPLQAFRLVAPARHLASNVFNPAVPSRTAAMSAWT
jgi:hypothetical protein